VDGYTVNRRMYRIRWGQVWFPIEFTPELHLDKVDGRLARVARSRTMSSMASRLVDVGANLTDPMFRGEYRSKQVHEPDIDAVLNRAWTAGLKHVIVTSGTRSQALEAKRFCKKDERLSYTVGVHPTRCLEFEESDDPQSYLKDLEELLCSDSRAVAVGECGLDYDRTEFCPKEVQIKWFEAQFQLARASGKPMFLHMRNAANDFLDIIARNYESFPKAVVHSFTGTEEEAKRILDMDKLYIGINGCSLRTEENLAAMSVVPLDRMVIETDAPWCEVRRSHAGHMHIGTHWEAVAKEKQRDTAMVKSRNEPCKLVQVVEVIAGHRGIPVEDVVEACYRNTVDVFFSNEE